jgi:SecD/SecF fusion protein
MSKKLQWRIFVTLAVLAASIYFALPLEKRINLGLDLKGGMHLVLRVELDKIPENAKSDAVIRAIEIIRNRIDSLGAGETVIQRQGEDQIIVQLPGITDRKKALKLIGETAQLEFSLVSEDLNLRQQALSGTVPDGYRLLEMKNSGGKILVGATPSMKGEAIKDAKVDFDSMGFTTPQIAFELSASGAKEFAEVTRKHVGEQLAVILDGKVISAPNIQEPILDGRGQITGEFTMEDAQLLALSLRSGSLPAPMKVEEERTIGPLLGKDSINSGINAAILGFFLVVGFMIVYYLLAGFISSIALVFNIVLTFGTLGLLNYLVGGSAVTLTLPGIAGIILTLGMAVDSNVLINERIREELANGRAMATAIANGYSRAFTAIFDSNITTLIAAAMLFQFGSGPIKGFALTLAIGLVASMFTALYVTRTIFLLLLNFGWIKKLPMLKVIAETKFDFVRYRYVFISASVILIAVTMTMFIQKKDAAYGIDFAGGQIQEYKFKTPVSSEKLREILKEAGVTEVVIQRFDMNPENVIIRTSEDTHTAVEGALKEKLADNPADLLRIEKVGPIVGKHLRERAVWAMLLAMGGILIYVAVRFKHWDFATAGVIALVHDVLVALGVTVALGHQIDLLTVTALLTIAGFSINDTIVIYDRIRENMARSLKYNLRDIINLSLNQTLSRTILTSFTVLMVTVALYLRGGEVLNTFSLCLIIGFIAGTYSTVYIAAPLVLAWQKKTK